MAEPSHIITEKGTGRRLRVQSRVKPDDRVAAELFAEHDRRAAEAQRTDRERLPSEPPAELAFPNFTVKPESVSESRPGVGTMAAEMGMSVAGGALGQTVGAAGGPVGMAVGGAIGSGLANVANQLIRMRSDPNYRFKYGELAADIGTGAIPGGPLMKTGIKAAAKEGLKQGAGGLVGGNVQSVIDEQRLQTGKENLLSGVLPAVAGAGAQRLLSGAPEIAQAAQAQRMSPPKEVAALEAAQKLGLKALPSDIKKAGTGAVGVTDEIPQGFFRTQLESLSGATASKRQIQLENQKPINDAVRRQLGIEGDEISPAALKEVRKKAGEVYERFAAIAEDAKPQLEQFNRWRDEIPYFSNDPGNAQRQALLDEFDARTATRRAELEAAVKSDPTELRRVRGEAQKMMDSYYSSGGKNVDAQLKAFELREQAKQIEEAMEVAARNSGMPELADDLIAARRQIARTYAAEDALNPGNFNIDPTKLAQQKARKVPLDGEMATIAEFASAFPQSVREASKAADPGVSTAATMLAGGGTLLTTKDPLLSVAAAAALPLAREAARGLLTSEGTQKRATEALVERVGREKIPVPTGLRAAEATTRMIGQQAGKILSDETPEVIREDVEALQSDPQRMKPIFEEMYGKGSSDKYLMLSAKDAQKNKKK